MKRSQRLLVVDDEEMIREMLTKILESLGYEVETACDGFEALAKLSFDIDLVLLDVNMPAMDGYEVARRIRDDSQHHDLPIIFVTGMASQEERIRAVEAGGNDFIAKPFQVTEVQVRTASLVRLKETNDELKRYSRELEETVAKRTGALRRALESMVETQRLLREANLETIQSLVVAAEFKDRDTAGHIQRMSHLSSMLARKLRLPPGEIELILNASPMHDIGKIGTPEDILLKPGKLTENEFKTIKEHPIYGSQILSRSRSDLLKTGKIIALTHHEKWDGSGYPHGLAGENIPLYGRICAVADVFDALTSERPYKEAFSNEEAVNFLLESSGKNFDPHLVELFLGNMNEVEEIQKKMKTASIIDINEIEDEKSDEKIKAFSRIYP